MLSTGCPRLDASFGALFNICYPPAVHDWMSRLVAFLLCYPLAVHDWMSRLVAFLLCYPLAVHDWMSRLVPFYYAIHWLFTIGCLVW